jgi:hypothetical protein
MKKATPRKGSIGWKLVKTGNAGAYAVVKLKVLGKVVKPAAGRSDVQLYNRTYGTKYRTNRAKVLGIYIRRDMGVGLSGGFAYHRHRRDREVESGVSTYDSTFVYRTGEIVRSRDGCGKPAFDSNPYNDCGIGIHFFATSKEALYYII